MASPYKDLPPKAFWKSGVVGQSRRAIDGLYKKKFYIDRTMRIATAGSCFAQHIARHLRKRGFSVLDAEPAPPGLTDKTAKEFGFGLYSARYGNIYTARQMLQLAHEAYGEFCPSDAIWEKDGRFYDAMRPSVEPSGLKSAEHVRDHRQHHMAAVREVIETSDLIIFTLGLTETWEHIASGTIYPTAPETIAGKYDSELHRFHNFGFVEVYTDMSAFFDFVLSKNASAKFLLTVSPVPLTATASDSHVLAATTYSKSVLRAVAGQLATERHNVDYFPSYEIITGALARGAFFEDNLRTVRPKGVRAAMNTFFAEHDASSARTEQREVRKTAKSPVVMSADDVICEDELLDAFAR